VAPPLTTRTLWAAGSLLAVAFLALMVVTGALPRSRQFVKFEAKGVMQLAPERISAVALHSGHRGAVFVRTPDGGWARDGGAPVAPAVARRLSLAVQFMNTSGPVRTISWSSAGSNLEQFGLAPPQLSIGLFEGARPVLAAHFGARNPDGYLQYVAVEGREELFLLSRFVGAEWDAVAKATLPP